MRLVIFLAFLISCLVTACTPSSANNPVDRQIRNAEKTSGREVASSNARDPAATQALATATETRLLEQPRAATTPIALTDCPVTPYVPEPRPPAVDASTVFRSTWYGNNALWAGLAPPYEGRWYAGPRGLKVLW